MAQTIDTNAYLSIKFPLTRGSEETSRTLNFPFPNENVADLQTQFDGLIAKFTDGSYPGIEYFIQPSNWRDTDDSEEAWSCDWTKVTAERVETTKVGMVYSG